MISQDKLLLELENAQALLSSDPLQSLAIASNVVESSQEGSELYNKALTLIGNAHYLQGNLDQSQAIFLDIIQDIKTHKQTNQAAEQIAAQLFLGRISRDKGKMDVAFDYIEQAIKIAKYSDLKHLQAEGHNLLAGLLFVSGRTYESLESLGKAIDIHKSQNELVAEIDCLNNMAILLYSLGDYIKSLEVSFECFAKLAESEDIPLASRVNCLNNIANVYADWGDLEKAVRYYEMAIDQSDRQAYSSSNLAILINYGAINLDLGNIDESLKVAQKSLDIAKQGKYLRHEGSILNNLGKIYRIKTDLHESLNQHNAALVIAQKIGEVDIEIDAFLGLAQSYILLADHTAAEEAINNGLKVAIASERHQKIANCYELLSEIFCQLNDFKKAFFYHKKYHELDKKLFNEENERRVSQLTTSFELKLAQEEAESYRQRNEAAEKALKAAEDVVQKRTDELEQAKVEVVTRLALAAEYRDDITGEHTKRVGYYAAAIALELGLKQDDVYLLQHAARLHDVGKIGIPDAILLKKDRLTTEEFEIIKKHTLIGERILSNGHSALLQMARDIAVSHHECWNGTGYPYNLANEDIPLTGRIVAVADVFDALTQPRPYKEAWSLLDSMAEIRRLSGSSFDPNVVEASLRVFGRIKEIREKMTLTELGVAKSLSNMSIHSQLSGPFASIEYFKQAMSSDLE